MSEATFLNEIENKKTRKEKTKTFQQRKSVKTSIDDFLFFTNRFPKKKKRKQEKKGKENREGYSKQGRSSIDAVPRCLAFKDDAGQCLIMTFAVVLVASRPQAAVTMCKTMCAV